DERLLQRVLEHLVLGDVHRRDREQHHEERHEQRDHVGVGQEPALVAALVASVPVPAALAAAASVRRAHAASRSSADGAPPSAFLPRSAGATKASSFSDRTRGLSPAWIDRMASRIIMRWLTSTADISLSLLPMGRNIRLALDTP